jgi:hypothetical protein
MTKFLRTLIAHFDVYKSNRKLEKYYLVDDDFNIYHVFFVDKKTVLDPMTMEQIPFSDIDILNSGQPLTLAEFDNMEDEF